MRTSLLTFALAGLLLAPALAHADTFSFSATGMGGGFSGAGQLTTTSNGDGSYTINGISGAGIQGLRDFNGSDQLLYPTASRLVDVNGFSFEGIFGGEDLFVNIFSTADAGYEAFIFDTDGSYNDVPVSFSVTNTTAVTPEPSSLLLLATGMAGLAVVGTRKFRTT